MFRGNEVPVRSGNHDSKNITFVRIDVRSARERIMGPAE